MSKYLVGSPQAEEFLDSTQINTGLKVLLGDPENMDKMVAPNIRSLHIDLRDASSKVARLAQDPTRNEIEKHQAARKVADAVVSKMTTVKNVIKERAKTLFEEATRQADLELGPKADRAGLHSEIRTWLSQTAKTPDGLEKIRAAMKESEDMAAVLWHSPAFLTGLPEELLSNLRTEGLQIHKPKIYADFSGSIALGKLAERYDSTIRKASVSFYSHAMVEQAKHRVEV